jgi:CRISPR-associated endonuclease Cas1
MQWQDHTFGDVRNGTLVLSGHRIRLTVELGHLIVRDGLAGAEIERRIPRAGCPISRVIATRDSGYITLGALHWLDAVGVSMAVLDYDGRPIFASCPRAPIPARLRRAQALLTVEAPEGRAIITELIRAKIAGQCATLRALGEDKAAVEATLAVEGTLLDVLGVEGLAAGIYWQALARRPVPFGRRVKVPEAWRAFGPRRSPISGTPRGAVLPSQAALNYLYNVAISEITIALHACGLDPALGLLHADRDERASLSYDLLEPLRPFIDRWFFDWLAASTFSRRDFFEGHAGEVRLMHPLPSHLAMTAPLWRPLAEDVAGWFQARVEGSRQALVVRPVVEETARRRARVWEPGRAVARVMPRTCRECGKALSGHRRRFCSDACKVAWYGERPGVRVGLAAIARVRASRKAADEPPVRRVSQITAPGLVAWRALAAASPMTDEALRAWYSRELAPRVAETRPRDIREALRCSVSYAVEIRTGRRIPHPRLFRALAALAGVALPSNFPAPSPVSAGELRSSTVL